MVFNIAFENWFANLDFYDISGDVVFVAVDDSILDENCLYFVRIKFTDILELVIVIVLRKNYTIYIIEATEI